MKLVATYDGQKHEIGQPSLKDFVMLERQFGIGAQKVSDDPRMEYMIFLAYCSLKRQGVVTVKYGDDFLDRLESVEDDEAEDDAAEESADPTGPTAEAQSA